MDTILGAGGLFARRLPNYRHRPQQVRMAELVAECIANAEHAVIEAGTGTGKSFAYLVPAILSGHKTIVSTANRTLQDQLVRKDLPFLARTLEHEFTYTVAKGKSNYLCLIKVKQNGMPEGMYDWFTDTEDGDLDTVPIYLDYKERRTLGAGDDCPGPKCPMAHKCYYYKAKLARLTADVVVTNHAQLCQHLLLPMAQILPSDAPVLIVDEAHQLESYAVNADSVEVTPHAFRLSAAKLKEDATRWLQSLVPAGTRDDTLILAESEYSHDLGQALLDLADYVNPGEIDDLGALEEDQQELYMHRLAEAKQIQRLAESAQKLADPTGEGFVRHYRMDQRGPVGMLTRYKVDEFLSNLTRRFHTVVYTSATLSTGPNDFAFFMRRNGITEAQTLQVSSPFDYQRQAGLYLPKSYKVPMPQGRTREAFDATVTKHMYNLVKSSEGHALLLFTSWRAMEQAERKLREVLPYPVRAQGNGNRSDLIAWLKHTPHAVLCATASFWEGVDIPGDALRLVAIDKLPFASPSPVETARQEELGAQAFYDLQIPEATLRLKQGFGRLIRRETDRGVVAILDPRLWRRPYGRGIVRALPAAQLLITMDEVRAFYGAGRVSQPIEPRPQLVAVA